MLGGAAASAASLPRGIAVGPDGNLWFAERGSNAIGRMTPAGDVRDFPLPTVDADVRYVAWGPDCNLWFTEFAAHQVGKASVTFGEGGASGN